MRGSHQNWPEAMPLSGLTFEASAAFAVSLFCQPQTSLGIGIFGISQGHGDFHPGRALRGDLPHHQRAMRIAQMVICPVPPAELVETDELDETDRGVGGFGHTGN